MEREREGERGHGERERGETEVWTKGGVCCGTIVCVILGGAEGETGIEEGGGDAEYSKGGAGEHHEEGGGGGAPRRGGNRAITATPCMPRHSTP